MNLGPARPLRLPRRRRHRAEPVRAAGAARAAERERHGRTPPSAWNRARAVPDLHGHDRRAGQARRWRRARHLGHARPRDRRTPTVRCGGRRAKNRRPRRGAAEPARAVRAARLRQRLLVGRARGRGARLPLRAVRRPGARRGGERERGLRPRRHRRLRLRGRLGRRAPAARAGRLPAGRPRARAGAQPRARRGDGADRAGHGLPARRALPDRDRQPPAGRGREPHELARDLRRGEQAARHAAAALALQPCRDDRRAPRGLRPGTRLHRQRPLVQQPAADPGEAAGPRGPRRLLDLHLHQLPADAAAPDRVGQDLPRRGADDRRRALARVLLRARRVQRAGGDQAERHRLSGRPGQRAGDLERLGNQYWPAEYLIDANGHVRHVNFGEGDYDKTEAAIRALLREAGAEHLPGDAKPSRTYDPAQDTTPETYLGTERAERVTPEVPKDGTGNYTPVTDLPLSHFSYGGTWTFTGESATAGPGAQLLAHVAAKDVYLVLSPSKHGPGTVAVSVDGKHEQTVKVTSQRLYHLMSRRAYGEHELALRFSPGVAGYAFTFG